MRSKTTTSLASAFFVALLSGQSLAASFPVGNLVVADYGSIYLVDPVTGASQVALSGPFGDIYDVTFNPVSGSVFYVTGGLTSPRQIMELRATPDGFTTSLILDGLARTETLTVDRQGNLLFDQQDFVDHDVWRAYLDGRIERVSNSGAGGLFVPNDMELSLDGQGLYVANIPSNNLEFVDLTTGTIQEVSPLSWPTGIALAADGTIFVTEGGPGDPLSDRISSIAPNGVRSTYAQQPWMEFLGSGFWTDLEYDDATGTLYAGKGRLYAIDRNLDSRQLAPNIRSVRALDIVSVPEPCSVALLVGAMSVGAIACMIRRFRPRPVRFSRVVLVVAAFVGAQLSAVVAHAARITQSSFNFTTGHQYHIIKADDGVSGVTWTQAEAFARSLGGHLATINNSAENTWIATQFSDPYLWIGLNDAAQDGRFVWSSGEPVSFTYWWYGEPNNYGGDEDYVQMYNFDNGERRWNDNDDASGNANWPFVGLAEVPARVLPLTLVPSGATWRYLADGSNQGQPNDGASWFGHPAYDDSSWPTGRGQLGYGDGDETTVVSCGPSAPSCTSANFSTTYFRHAFQVGDPAALRELNLQLLRDDAAAVYLNGVQVFRDGNLPVGSSFDTYATAASADNAGATMMIDPGLLRTGANVLAVEVHQAASSSTDMSFDLRLAATPVPEPSTFCIAAFAAVIVCVGKRYDFSMLRSRH